jgi:hypothetical protein
MSRIPIPPREFTDEDAKKFRRAMRDSEYRAKLYEELAEESRKIHEETRRRHKERNKPNEYGFTRDEVEFLQNALSEDEPIYMAISASPKYDTDDSFNLLTPEYLTPEHHSIDMETHHKRKRSSTKSHKKTKKRKGGNQKQKRRNQTKKRN